MKFVKFSYGSFNQHWHKCQSGRADLPVSQKAAQQHRPTMLMRQCCFDLPYYLNPTPNDRNVEFDPKQNL